MIVKPTILHVTRTAIVKVTWVQLHYSGEQSAALADKLKEVFFTFLGIAEKVTYGFLCKIHQSFCFSVPHILVIILH